MSLLIKDLQMPECCEECPCFRHDSLEGIHAYQCNLTLKSYAWLELKRPDDCPLEEVTEG